MQGGRYHLFLLLILLFQGVQAQAEEKRGDPARIVALFERILIAGKENSSEIFISKTNLEKKDAQRGTAFAKRFPKLEMDLYREAEDTLKNRKDGLKVNMQLPIYKRTNQIFFESTKAEYEQALANDVKMTKTFELKVRNLFIKYLTQKYKIQIYQRQLIELGRQIKLHKISLKLGGLNKLDYINREIEKELTVSRIEIGSQKLNSILLELSGILSLGMESAQLKSLSQFEATIDEYDAGIEVIADLNEQLSIFSSFAQGAEDVEGRLRSKSPGYLDIVAKEKIDLIQAKQKGADEWPELNLQGAYEEERETYPSVSRTHNKTLGIHLIVPISLGGSFFTTRREYQRAKSIIKASSARERKAYIDSFNKDLKTIKSLRKMLDLQKIIVKNRAELRRLTEISFKLGKIDLKELIDRRNDYISSKIEYVRIIGDLGILLRKTNIELDLRK